MQDGAGVPSGCAADGQHLGAGFIVGDLRAAVCNRQAAGSNQQATRSHGHAIVHDELTALHRRATSHDLQAALVDGREPVAADAEHIRCVGGDLQEVEPRPGCRAACDGHHVATVARRRGLNLRDR